jgi:hypothetical protein
MMKPVRSALVAAIILFPLSCERRELSPGEQLTPAAEPGAQTRPLTPDEPGEREHVRGIADDEAPGTVPGAAEEGRTERVTAAGNQTIDRITHARCLREERCGNVGPDRRFVSMQSCMNKTRTEWQDELDARECPGGVVQGAFSECLARIEQEACDEALDSLGHIAACGESDICNSPGAR